MDSFSTHQYMAVCRSDDGLLNGFVYGVREKSCAGVSVFIYAFGLVALMWSEISRMEEYFCYVTLIDRVKDKYNNVENRGEIYETNCGL